MQRYVLIHKYIYYNYKQHVIANKFIIIYLYPYDGIQFNNYRLWCTNRITYSQGKITTVL